jgi:hypothetical protein
VVSSTLQKVETEAIRDVPLALGVAETFFPAIRPIDAILVPLLPTIIEAVNTIIDATGATPTQAAAAVAAHLTPGLPNSPALSPTPQVAKTPA